MSFFQVFTHINADAPLGWELPWVRIWYGFCTHKCDSKRIGGAPWRRKGWFDQPGAATDVNWRGKFYSFKLIFFYPSSMFDPPQYDLTILVLEYEANEYVFFLFACNSATSCVCLKVTECMGRIFSKFNEDPVRRAATSPPRHRHTHTNPLKASLVDCGCCAQQIDWLPVCIRISVLICQGSDSMNSNV